MFSLKWSTAAYHSRRNAILALKQCQHLIFVVNFFNKVVCFLSVFAGYEGSNFVCTLPLLSSSVISEILRCQRIEIEIPSNSSPKSHRVRHFLPSFKLSYMSLILVLVCGMNLMRNESTNDRLLALENQMEIL